MKRWREWLPQLVMESVVVVFSILLALAASQWWDGRETEAAVERSLLSLRSEIERNREKVDEAHRYHADLADTLKARVAAGATEVEDDVAGQGWLLTPELSSAAWQAASVTGIIADMPPDVVLMLSEVYERQAQYLASRAAVTPVLYDNVIERGDMSFAPMFRPLAGIVSDVASWERILLGRYDGALKELHADPSG